MSETNMRSARELMSPSRPTRPRVPELIYGDAASIPDADFYRADELDDEQEGQLMAEYRFTRFVRVKAPPRTFEIVNADE